MFTEMTNNFEAWKWMWIAALGLWLVFKLLMLPRTNTGAALSYLLAWPGMDAAPFAQKHRRINVRAREWFFAMTKTAAGLALIVLAPRLALPALTVGWIGMVGAVLFLHFGVFQLITLGWRTHGVPVEPIMDRPAHAKSLADFWSRWNRGFRDLAFKLVFRPLHRRIGSVDAMFATFVFSGIVHDLVISIPARGGFGMPTLYFIIQGLGVVFEKSPLGRRTHSLIIRSLMYVILIAPLPLLFHPWFVLRVFVPFLDFIKGAI